MLQHIKHMDHMVAEIDRLSPKLPLPKVMGIKETDKARFITTAKHARNFSIEQMKQIITKSQSLSTIDWPLQKRKSQRPSQTG